jgi:predicted GTPase
MGSLSDFTSNTPQKAKVENRYLSNKDMGIELLAKLISTQNENSDIEVILHDLESMIENEFLALTEKDKCPGSAETYANLQKAFQDLIEIVNFPELENKFTIAVGGQFSSGKSRFLNRVIDAKQLLPTDTSATTAIPTYIVSGKQNSVFALNNYQGKTEIDDEALHAISHAFKARYNLSFSHILKLIAVERKSFKWKNISFLDTPGYSKADSIKSRSNNTDENIAREHLRTADYLIWLTDIQNGTIPEEDIQFINSLQFDEPVLFVLNKADKKIEAEIYEIIQISKENLTKNEILFFDVIGFSAMKNQEYSSNKNVLQQFIEQINSQKAGTHIIKRFHEIFEDYLNFHKSEAEFLRVSRKTINDAFFEAYKQEKEHDKLKSLTRKLQKQITAIVNSEKSFDSLRKRMNLAINDVFNKLNIEIVEGYAVKKRKKHHAKSEVFKFNAMIQIQNESELSKLGDFTKIKGIVTGIKAIGVSIQIMHQDKILGDAMITKAEIRTKVNTDPKVFFSDFDDVNIQYLGNKMAIVEITKII